MEVEDIEDIETDIWKRPLSSEPITSGPLKIVPREKWGAQPTTFTDPLPHPVNIVVFAYNTGGKCCYTDEDCEARMREMQQKHIKERGLEDIAYNFLVGGNSKVYEGRGWDLKSSKTLPLPRRYGKRLDIAWIGNNIGTDYIPQHILRPAYQMIRKGMAEGKIILKHQIYEVRHKPCEDTYYYHPLYEDPQYL